MIINGYSVLAGFLAVLRLVLAVAVAAVACRRRSSHHELAESRYYLVILLAGLLLGLSLLSWPLLYAVLQSYVPQWPGVMCIYGVTRIGLGSTSVSRFLPGLLATIQLTHPLLLFAGGGWLSLYLANRLTLRDELAPRTLWLVILFSLLAAADAVAEGAYLLIPKAEQFADAGCCAAAAAPRDRFVPAARLEPGERPWLQRAYVLLNAAVPLGLLWRRFRVRGSALAGLGLVALASFPLNYLYLVEIAAPAILRLPYHHCPYDLVPVAPEALVGVALFVGGAFAIGWACVVDWWGRPAGRLRQTGTVVERLLLLAAFGYASSLLLISVEVGLA